MNKVYAAIDRASAPLAQKAIAAYQAQKETHNTLPVWLALLVSVPMVFLDISGMNVMTILMAGIFGLFAFTGKESHDPLSPVDKWRLFAPMVILMVPSILCIGEVEGLLLSSLGWISVAAATLFAIVASHRILVLQSKTLPMVMKVLAVVAVPTYVLLKPALLIAEIAGEWMMAHWRSVMVWSAFAVGVATVWFPLPADDFISIAGGVLGVIFGVSEFRNRDGNMPVEDMWAIGGASALAISLGVLCPGNMFASAGLMLWATAVSAASFVLAGYFVSKTQTPPPQKTRRFYGVMD
jgi:hypothetical protein